MMPAFKGARQGDARDCLPVNLPAIPEWST